jgi:hypothetical protein
MARASWRGYLRRVERHVPRARGAFHERDLVGKAEPALLKRRTVVTPSVSDLSNGTSSVMMASE